MKNRLFSMLSLLLTLCLLVPMAVRADPVERQNTQAEDISGTDIVTDHQGFSGISPLFDGRVLEGKPTTGAASLTLSSDAGIGSLYLIFGGSHGTYTLTDNDTATSCTVGTYDYLHDYLDLTQLFGAAPKSVTLDFPDTVTLYELQVYTEGQVPESVQKWTPPADGEADLVLFSTHGDDEQLFFAGVLPYYAKERGYNVQVVYFTNHPDEPMRMHEMLNGLWAVGVTCYPVFGEHPDFFSKNMAESYASMERRGYSREDLLEFVVENIRRFRPQVAVGHDINGEYGHAMHKIYTDLLMEAVTISTDAAVYPESADRYGVWDVPKTYLHLYEENQIVMDWDQPLESFDGMTAFQVTKELGYPCHKSQYKDFAWYLSYYDTAAECPKYNPCYYGLFRSTVGADMEKNDFFENVTTHAEAARIAEEEQLEAERLAAEEEARRREEQARLEEEARLAEEARRQEAAAQAAETERLAQAAAQAQLQEAQAHKTKFIIAIAVEITLIILLIVLLSCRIRRKKQTF